MELLIKASDIYVEYHGRDVLTIDELEIHAFDRIGLVGGNGAGKSTLLKVLLGSITPSGCRINRLGRFAYIPQLEDACLSDVDTGALMSRLGVLELQHDGLSGGEETRQKIAQALSEQVHGILADEPTCHLDRSGIEFLIGQLKRFSGAVVVISHDRYFLDQVVDKIWELKDGRITEYWGGYSDYLQQKEEERQRKSMQYELLTTERDRLTRAAEEKQKQARKIEQKAKSTESAGRMGHEKSAGSKQKTLHNAAKNIEHRIASLGNIRAPEALKTVRFRQSKALELHNPYPIIASDLNKQLGERLLFKDVTFQIPLGAKVAFIGDNGVGKTVLFRMILNREAGISVSPKAQIGYFEQQGYKVNQEQVVMEFMQEDCEYQHSEVRSVLAAMGFSQQDIHKPLAVLSGGEIIKLHLAKMLLGKYNILLMDEPSNFLDLPSMEALETMMKRYSGTILFISHDKRLIENVADMVYEITDGKLVRREA